MKKAWRRSLLAACQLNGHAEKRNSAMAKASWRQRSSLLYILKMFSWLWRGVMYLQPKAIGNEAKISWRKYRRKRDSRNEEKMKKYNGQLMS
jgi:hypothetical protein